MQKIRSLFTKNPTSNSNKPKVVDPPSVPTESPTKHLDEDLHEPGLRRQMFDVRTVCGTSPSSSRNNMMKTMTIYGISSESGQPNPTVSLSRNLRSPCGAGDERCDSNFYLDLKRSVTSFQLEYGSFIGSKTYDRAELNPAVTRHDGIYSLHMSSSITSLQTFSDSGTVVYSPRSVNGTDNGDYDDNDNDDHSFTRSDQGDENPLTRERFHDLIAELTDPNCMDPFRTDLHDSIIANLFTNNSPSLPHILPARHMHVLDYEKLLDVEHITIFEYACPRLCDAIATVLFQSGVEILNAFLNPRTKVFEWWRRTPDSPKFVSVLIRRVHNEVLVGVFRDLRSTYVWGYYVKSIVDLAGKWTEVFASSTTATTIIREDGPDWESFTPIEADAKGIDCRDPKFALYTGRNLARSLLQAKIWDLNRTLNAGGMSEWVADRKRTEIVG